MSRFVRLLPPHTVGRRSYSFFSSKSGGGRYFNSSKPPTAPATAAGSSTTSTSANATTIDSSSPSSSSSSAPSTSPSEPVEEKEAPVTSTLEKSKADKSHFSPSSPPAPPPKEIPRISTSPLPHPILKPQDLKLHHFFSLHRPLLLLNLPSNVIFESSEAPAAKASPTPKHLGTIDDPPEASPEADADAARQLSRALVVNRVGSTAAWEDALQRLGYRPPEEPTVTDPTVAESANVVMDSTRRKRRRKMKKHQLKKRRRLSRSTRLRLGK